MERYLILTAVAKQEDSSIPGKGNTCVKTQDRKEVRGSQQVQVRDSLLRLEYAVREEEEMKQHAEENQVHPSLLPSHSPTLPFFLFPFNKYLLSINMYAVNTQILAKDNILKF